jgi:hypothetical protein
MKKDKKNNRQQQQTTKKEKGQLKAYKNKRRNKLGRQLVGRQDDIDHRTVKTNNETRQQKKQDSSKKRQKKEGNGNLRHIKIKDEAALADISLDRSI